MIQILTYWKMAWLRAFLYAAICGGGTFMALSETWSDATWTAMGPFLKARFFLSVGLSAFGAILAFVDQTMGVLRQARPEIPPIIRDLVSQSGPAPQPLPETKG
jgi:hypothetical protein